MKACKSLIFLLVFGLFANQAILAGDGHDHSGHGHDHSGHNHNHAGHDHSGHNHSNHKAAAKAHSKAGSGHDAHAAHGHDDHGDGGHDKLDVGKMIIDHILDANEFHVAGSFSVPLPCIVYNKKTGFDFFMSSVFEHGHSSHNGYVLDHGVLKYVDDPSFPKTKEHVNVSLADKQAYVSLKGRKYPASRSGFYDFSITKVVFTMLLTLLIMLLLFPAIARAYSKRDVPKGVQSFFEPIIMFVRDDIAEPNLGDRTEKFMPYLLTLFFFIWINNLLGLVPFFPGSGNVTGNIAVTMALAIIAFFVINLNGNKAYWGHLFNPPGVPLGIKFILVPIEILSVFIKPFALMLRLFANIAAGHIIILSFVGIVFIVANLAGTGAGFGTSIISGLFLLFMNALELFVAALQAYIFTVLTAVFIGQATEEHHGHEEAHH